MEPRSPSRRIGPAVALLACLVLTLLAAGCKKSPAAKIVSNPPAGWASRAIPGTAVTFRAPPNWHAGRTDEDGTFTIQPSSAGSYVYMRLAPREAGIDAGKLADKLMKQYAAGLTAEGIAPSAQLVEVAGVPAARINYDRPAAADDASSKVTAYVLISDAKVCYVSFYARPENVSKHAQDFEQVVASVRMMN